MLAAGQHTGDGLISLVVLAPPITETLTKDTGGSASDKTTSDPALSGTATANAVVTLTEGIATLGTATADNTGAWTFAPTSLPDGPHTIVASTASPVASATLTFTLDTAPPALPVITTAALTNDTTPVISGTAEPGATVEVSVPANAIYDVIAGKDGGWSVDTSLSPASGSLSLSTVVSNTISVVAIDPAGNQSGAAQQSLVVDIIAPGAPVITSPLLTNDATPVITGTAEPGATVTVTVGGATYTTPADNSTGAWSLDLGTASPISGILSLDLNGNNTVTATAADPAGNVSSPVAQTLSLDTTPPPTPSPAVLTVGSDSGPLGDSTTDDTTPTLTGTGEVGSTITLTATKDLVSTVLGTAVVGGDGHWSFTPSSALGFGDYSVTATATDPAGNTSPLASIATLRVVPASPTITPNGPSGRTVVTAPTVSGTNTAGDAVQVTVSGTRGPTNDTGTATVTGPGTWSFNPGTLLPGHYTISATDISAGVTSDPTTQTLDIIPPPPGRPDLQASSDTGPVSTDNVTKVTLPVLSGSGVNGDIITLIDTIGGTGTIIGTGTVVGGAWGIKATTPLIQGLNPVTATETDPVGGTTSDASGVLNINLNTVAPVVGSITATPSVTTPSATVLGVGRTVVIHLPLSVPVTLTGKQPTLILNDGGTATLAGQSSEELSFSYTVLAGQDTAGLGISSLSLNGGTIVDLAGNPLVLPASMVFSPGLTIDTTAPAAPGTPDLSPDSDSGVSNSDDITNATTPTFTGTGEAGATVTLFDNGGSIGTGTVGTLGTWSIAPTGTLVEGANAITATQTDVALNVSPASGTLAVTLDTLPPPKPTALLLAPATDNGPSATDDITNIGLPIISGSGGEAGDTVILFDGSTAIGTGTVAVGGDWTITATTSLSAGDNSLSVTQTDLAGNVSDASTPLLVTLDQTPPAAPGAPVLSPGSNSGFVANDTNVTLPTFTGTGEAGNTVTLFDGSTAIGTGTVAAGGGWSITATTALAEGANTITATQTDAAGNVSLSSGPLAVILDTVAPDAPDLPDLLTASDSGVSNTDNITNVTHPIIDGTASEVGDRIAVFDNGGSDPIGFGVVGPGGVWAITSSGSLTEGLNTITAKQIDPAGNVSDASAGLPVILETIPTTITSLAASGPGITDGSGSLNLGKTITLTANFGVPVFVNGDSVPTLSLNDGGTATYVSGSGSGVLVFSYTVGADQNTPAGGLAASAFNPNGATDAAGNATSTSGAALTGTVQINTVLPRVNSLAWSGPGISGGDAPGNGDLKAGAVISLTATFNEAVTVAGGTPTFLLNDGGAATYVSGSGSNTLVFSYTVGATDNTPDLEVTSLRLGDATITDLAGNQFDPSSAMPQSAGTLIIDTIAPLAPSALLLVSDSGSSTSDGITNIGLPVISGTGEVGAVVSLFDNAGTTAIGTGTVGTLGTWSITATTSLTEGVNSLTATQVDPAGNTSTAFDPLVVTLDKTVAAPAGLTLAPASDSGAKLDDITNVGLPVITGTGEAGAVVTLLDGTTTIGTGTVAAGGDWTITAATPLSEGANSLTATQVDPAGNTSTASGTAGRHPRHHGGGAGRPDPAAGQRQRHQARRHHQCRPAGHHRHRRGRRRGHAARRHHHDRHRHGRGRRRLDDHRHHRAEGWRQ